MTASNSSSSLQLRIPLHRAPTLLIAEAKQRKRGAREAGGSTNGGSESSLEQPPRRLAPAAGDHGSGSGSEDDLALRLASVSFSPSYGIKTPSPTLRGRPWSGGGDDDAGHCSPALLLSRFGSLHSSGRGGGGGAAFASGRPGGIRLAPAATLPAKDLWRASAGVVPSSRSGRPSRATTTKEEAAEKSS